MFSFGALPAVPPPWSDDLWVKGTTDLADHEWVELVANLAGNAWSLWHYAPIAMASMAVFGRFSFEDCTNVALEEIVDVSGSESTPQACSQSSLSD